MKEAPTAPHFARRSPHFGVIVLGAGIAGASAVAEIALDSEVLMVESDGLAGRHATGRSAAMFFTSYGNETIRGLTRASQRFLASPPVGFCESPLLTPRPALIVASGDMVDRLDRALLTHDSTGVLRRSSPTEAKAMVPILRDGWVAAAIVDETSSDIDVASLHQGFIRVAKRRGASVVLDAGEVRLHRVGALWHVSTRAGSFSAPVVVNATGAWGDVIAEQAGVRPIGLQPLRRSALTISPPAGFNISGWPAVIDAGESFYFKPDAGQLLLSPANEDASPPCDAVPEELDIALAVDRFERATTVEVRRVNQRWAGLRSFVADRSPVIGFDPTAEGFFWLVGQGGYGIQTSPAAASAAAALVAGRPLPAQLLAEGVDAAALAPGRAAIGASRDST